MISSTRNTICLFFVLSLVSFVLSIKCWDCRSNNEPKCADPFDNTTIPITDCKQEKGPSHLPGMRPTCRKIRQKVNGIQEIIRDCEWKRQDDFTHTCPATSNGPHEVTTFCETCDSDGCNGASAIGKTIAWLLAPLSLLLFK